MGLSTHLAVVKLNEPVDSTLESSGFYTFLHLLGIFGKFLEMRAPDDDGVRVSVCLLVL